MTRYDPGPATDQWSCDCGQHARRSKACISVRVSSRPKKRSGDRMPQDILDTDKMEARLPEDKLSRIISILDLLENKHSISKKELLSLLGYLNFASRNL